MATLIEGTKSINFAYNTEEQRGRAQYYTGPTLTRTRYYAENYERTITPAGTQQISYVMAEGKPVAMFVTNGLTGPSDIKYIGTDHLGSITEILNSTGSLDEQRSYDAWGRMRDPGTWVPYTAGTTPLTDYDRGYTGQELLKDFNVINLNGRLYDPLIGRMFSVDPYITNPDNAQTYNTYSYCNNNPLKYTDKNGEFLAAAFFGFTFAAGFLGNVATGVSNPAGTAYDFAASATNSISNAMQFPLYTDNNTRITGGLDFFGGGVAVRGTHRSGDFTASGSVGVGLFGIYGYLGVNQKVGNSNFGLGVGIDGSGAPTFSGSIGHKGASFALNWYGGQDAQLNWTAGYKNGDFGLKISEDWMPGSLGGDKFRTGAVEINYKSASVGFNLYTSDHEKVVWGGKGGNTTYKSRWGENIKGTYSIGSRVHAAIYMGYSDGYSRSRLGVSSPGIQDFVQNRIHKWIGSPYYNTDLGTPKGMYRSLLANNPHSLY